MTIDRQHGKQSVTCDACGEQIERGSDCMHFDEWVDALKDEGWRFYKRRGDWQHECPQCNGK